MHGIRSVPAGKTATTLLKGDLTFLSTCILKIFPLDGDINGVNPYEDFIVVI
jgi:hypothetical protein